MRQVRRIIVVLAGMIGLLGLFAGPASAGMNLQHCEPLLRYAPDDTCRP
jgi:hypothetical protein